MKDRNSTFVAAMKMKISRKAAANMRARFLAEELLPLLDSWARTGNPISFCWMMDILDEIVWLKKKSTAPVIDKKNGVTDEMVEAAKNADVRSVVDFSRRGKALAWCHEDKRPSLYYGDRINRAICPVCDKKFNAIDVLMGRDGYGFLDAVKALN